MADNSTVVPNLKVAVASIEELKTSAAGKPYIRLKVVHEDGAEKTWFNAVAFGVLAKAISKKVTKGNKMLVNGSVSQKEYEKKNDGGVGVENKLVINSVKVSNGTTVEELDEFSVL